jgi:hypothetical protein
LISPFCLYHISIDTFPTTLQELHHTNCIILSPTTIQLLTAAHVNIINLDTALV